VNCERTTDYGSRISGLKLTSLIALFVFLLCRVTSGAFTIDSSTPIFRINLNEHPILLNFNEILHIQKISFFFIFQNDFILRTKMTLKGGLLSIVFPTGLGKIISFLY
jgi:hypothetical protein